MTKKISPRDWEAISAYLDGQLSSKELARLEDRLRSNADLRSAMTEMRRTRAMLRSQPRLRAPRNFTLTPEMVGQRPAVTPSLARPTQRLYPAMRLASALASLLFVLVLLGDLLVGGTRQASPAPVEQVMVMEAEAPSEAAGAQMRKEALPQAAPAEGSTSPGENQPEVEMGAAAAPTYNPTEIAAMTAAPAGKGGEVMTENETALTPTPSQEEAPLARQVEPTRVEPFAAEVDSTQAADSIMAQTLPESSPEASPTPLALASPVPEEALPEAAIAAPPEEVVEDQAVPQESSRLTWTPLRYIEIGLALAALITGLTALYLRLAHRI